MRLLTSSCGKSVCTPVASFFESAFPHSLPLATCTRSITVLFKSSLSLHSLPHRVHAHTIFTTNSPVRHHPLIVPSSQSANPAPPSQYRSTTSRPYGSTNLSSAKIFYPFNPLLPIRRALHMHQIMSKPNQPLSHFPPTIPPVPLTHPYTFSCPH